MQYFRAWGRSGERYSVAMADIGMERERIRRGIERLREGIARAGAEGGMESISWRGRRLTWISSDSFELYWDSIYGA